MATERPENRDSLPVHLVMQGIAEADTAWSQRRCLPSHRFWSVATGETQWNSDETSHLEGCPRCSAQAERLQVMFHPVAPTPPKSITTKVLYARERLRRFRGSTTLHFSDEPALTGELENTQHEQWIHLHHAHWPEGTLLKITLAPPQSLKRNWNHLVVLRRECGASITHFRVQSAFPDDNAERCLGVQAIQLRDLPPTNRVLTKMLCDALDRARADDPISVLAPLGQEHSAWHQWVIHALEQQPRRDQRYVLQRIHTVLASLDRVGNSEGEPSLFLG